MQAKHITATGQTKQLALSDAVFAAPVNTVLLSQALHVYRSNQRQGTSKVKTRAEVNLTKKKWFRQKGTGNARHGAQSAPIFVGGGVAHGPTGNENWSRSLSKQMKRKALISALSAQAERVVVVDQVETLTGKTAAAYQLVTAVASKNDRVLVVLPEPMELVQRSLRNLPNVMTTTALRLSVLDASLASVLVFTSKALQVLEQRLTATKPKTQAAPAAAPTASVPTAPAPAARAARSRSPRPKTAVSQDAPAAKAAKTTTRKPRTTSKKAA